MSYAIATITSIIETSLVKDKALDALSNLWKYEVIEKLTRLSKGEYNTISQADIFSKEELEFVCIETLIDEIFDYTFEGSDFPCFPEESIEIEKNGQLKITYCSEGVNSHGKELTDYFCLNVQRKFGTKDFYTRQSDCEDSSGRDSVISSVKSDGSFEVIYSSC